MLSEGGAYDVRGIPFHFGGVCNFEQTLQQASAASMSHIASLTGVRENSLKHYLGAGSMERTILSKRSVSAAVSSEVAIGR